MFHLLVKIGLPLQGGKSVVCPIGTRLLRQEPDADIVFQHLFRRLPVLFVECEKEEWQGRGNQKNQSNIVAQAFPGQKVSTKKMSCRFVRPNTTLLFTSVKSFVMFTWANQLTSRKIFS